MSTYHAVMKNEFKDRFGCEPKFSDCPQEDLEIEHDWVLLTVARSKRIRDRAESQIQAWEDAERLLDSYSAKASTYRVMADLCRIMCGQKIERHVSIDDVGYLTLDSAMLAIAGP